MTDLALQQSLGAEFLDTHRPGWRSEIDTSILDLENYRDCIGGQLFGTYSEFLNWVEYVTGEGARGDWPARHGFHPSWDENQELTALWIDEVLAEGDDHR